MYTMALQKVAADVTDKVTPDALARLVHESRNTLSCAFRSHLFVLRSFFQLANEHLSL
jgi:hypothetical protein